METSCMVQRQAGNHKPTTSKWNTIALFLQSATTACYSIEESRTKSTDHKLQNNWGTKEMLKNIVTNPKKEVNDKGWVL